MLHQDPSAVVQLMSTRPQLCRPHSSLIFCCFSSFGFFFLLPSRAPLGGLKCLQVKHFPGFCDTEPSLRTCRCNKVYLNVKGRPTKGPNHHKRLLLTEGQVFAGGLLVLDG